MEMSHVIPQNSYYRFKIEFYPTNVTNFIKFIDRQYVFHIITK